MSVLPDTSSAQAWNANAWQNAEPVVDPSTELDANVAKEIACNAAAVSRTALRAVVRFVAASTGNATVTDHDAVWGNADAVKPVVTAYGNSGAPDSKTYRITWPATVYDELGGAHSVNVRFPVVLSVLGDYVGRGASVQTHTANTIDVVTYSPEGKNYCSGSSFVVGFL